MKHGGIFKPYVIQYQMECKYCTGPCVKMGFQKNGSQKYRCKSCKRYQQAQYKYTAYGMDINHQISSLVTERVGIRSIGRLLGISCTTVIRRISAIASTLSKPNLTYGGDYEIDELWTYCGSKSNEVWITYVFERSTGRVIDFHLGRRSKVSIGPMVYRLLGYEPRRIATDGLAVYRSLIPKAIHSNKPFQTLRIERHNLNLRTHIKRLSRRTISYSKCILVLRSILKIYFWRHLNISVGH